MPGVPRIGTFTRRVVFPEIETISIGEKVVATLKDAFFSGQLKPGDVIIERELARQMKIGTPTVREALIALQGQGFVRRVANTATYVTSFSPEEVRDLYALRVELECLALQWAKPRATKADLEELERLVDSLVDAGERADRRAFLERDLALHKRCWALSGNAYLRETLERLMAPLFAFVVLASGMPLTAAMAREHYEIVNALRNLRDPEFSTVIRRVFSGFSLRWVSSMAHRDKSAVVSPL
jgi:DNA-binding GntR family transcriptional regulator